MRVLATLAILAGLATPATAQSFDFEQRLPASTDRIEITTDRGRIEIRGGAGDQVVIRGRVSVRVGFGVPADAVALARVTASAPPVTVDAGAVRLRRPDDERTREAVTIAWQVEVPARMAVTTVSDSGETTVGGTTGAVSVTTQSARIALTALGGEAVVHTGSGDVTAEGVGGALRVTTSSSSVTASGLAGALHVRTDSGRVKAAFAGTGDADVETGSSQIELQNLAGGLVAATNSGRVIVHGRPGRDWTITTGSSRIDVTLPADAAFTLDAASGSSSVNTDNMMVEGESTPRRVAGTIDGGGATIRLNSRSGSIHVERGGNRR